MSALGKVFRPQLNRAWQRWQDHLAREAKKQQLAQPGLDARVRLPAAFRRLKQHAALGKHKAAYRQRLADERGKRGALEGQLREAEEKRVRDIDELHAQADSQKHELETKLSERETAAAQALASAAERTYEQAVHFFLQRRLAKGWHTWRASLHRRSKATQERDRKLLLAAVQRMVAPSVATAYSRWRRGWQATRRKMEAAENAAEVRRTQEVPDFDRTRALICCRSSLC